MNEYENIKSEKKIEKSIDKSIESLYILKDIFSFLSEKQKLKIIIYDKYLQNKLNINIKESNKYNGKLEFEGGYLNGERNGKGKEYDYIGKLEFEGEYLNGKRNGKGKEYTYDGMLTYEGEYLNGEKMTKEI